MFLLFTSITATFLFFLSLYLFVLLKRARLQLEKHVSDMKEAGRQEALATLASGIAHDFNNILASILGFGALLEEDLTAHPDMQSLAGQITSAARRGQHIVAQLMSYSRKSMETDGHIRKPVSVDAIIKESLELLQPCIRRSTKMRYENKTENSTIIADATQLSQSVVNLCINADHAIGVKTGIIDIFLERKTFFEASGKGGINIQDSGDSLRLINGSIQSGTYISLSVRDNGDGMTPEIASRIFEPFFTTKDVDKGTGLGLPAIQGIVHGHGGAIIMVTSRHKGTTFELLFPIAA